MKDKSQAGSFEFCPQEDGNLTLLLTLDDDSQMEHEFVKIFGVQDKNYFAIIPISADTPKVMLYRHMHPDPKLCAIENEEELKAVINAYNAMAKEENLPPLIYEI